MRARRRARTEVGERGTNTGTGQRFRVDMAVCDGYGVCAELVPELIQRDDWGYPILADGVVPAELARYARRAVRCCPRLALSLIETERQDRK